MTEHIYKYPRLFLNHSFAENGILPLEQSQNHYLKNVLRKSEGDFVRLFNGRDGEWLGALTALGKKHGQVTLQEQLKEQPEDGARRHLYFSPIKKQRMDMLVEKAVELGVTDLHPVLMARTENRHLNAERLQAQVIEAAEQCERLDLPVVHEEVKWPVFMAAREVHCDVFAALERIQGTQNMNECDFRGDCAFLIGPEGGFDPQEIADIQANAHTKPISLGNRILRAETAAIACLAYASFKQSS